MQEVRLQKACYNHHILWFMHVKNTHPHTNTCMCAHTLVVTPHCFSIFMVHTNLPYIHVLFLEVQFLAWFWVSWICFHEKWIDFILLKMLTVKLVSLSLSHCSDMQLCLLLKLLNFLLMAFYMSKQLMVYVLVNLYPNINRLLIHALDFWFCLIIGNFLGQELMSVTDEL